MVYDVIVIESVAIQNSYKEKQLRFVKYYDALFIYKVKSIGAYIETLTLLLLIILIPQK